MCRMSDGKFKELDPTEEYSVRVKLPAVTSTAVPTRAKATSGGLNLHRCDTQCVKEDSESHS